MLISFRNGACALAAAMSFMGGAAHADNHVVLILEGGYFPAVTYARAGDNIVFRNESGATHKMQGPEGSWESGPIGLNAQYVLNLTVNTPLTFTEEVAEGEGMAGEVSYDEPPLADIITEDAGPPVN